MTLEMRMTQKEIERLAKKIANSIIVYHGRRNKKATRIVMEFKGGNKLDGPGLCYSALVGRIAEVLDKMRSPAA